VARFICAAVAFVSDASSAALEVVSGTAWVYHWEFQLQAYSSPFEFMVATALVYVASIAAPFGLERL
jgi:hypothetical protein